MAATVIAVLIGATALGLLIYGQHTSDLRAERRRVARINQQIATERDPGRRAACRIIRNQYPGDDQ
jgi:hypothetical protein